MSTASNNDLPQVLNVFGSTLSTAQVSPVLQNPYGRGVKVQVSVPVISAGSLVVTIQGLINGQAYTALASASITTTGTTILTVYPGLTASANVVANDVIPRQWQVTMTPTGFTGIVNIGACVIV